MEIKMNNSNSKKSKRIILDKRVLNWKRISFGDFGVKYSQDFIGEKKKEKMLWNGLLSQKSLENSQEE